MKQEIHFVTGKGGVGKSVIAAALALKKSREGKKVLLVELGNQSFFKDFFDLSEVDFQPRPLRENLSVALWTGEACLREYARYLIKVESLYKIFFENAVMRAFINIAPALPELAIMGKITSGPRKHGPPLKFDCLVVDAFATGHFMALMEAPHGMAQAVQFGPMGEQSRGIDACLRDASLCQYHVVTLPEELPMKEATELCADLEKQWSVQPRIILNKVLEVPVSLAELKAAQKNSSSGEAEFAQYLEQHVEQQKTFRQEADKITKKISEVPLFFEGDPWQLVEKVGDKLL